TLASSEHADVRPNQRAERTARPPFVVRRKLLLNAKGSLEVAPECLGMAHARAHSYPSFCPSPGWKHETRHRAPVTLPPIDQNRTKHAWHGKTSRTPPLSQGRSLFPWD